MLLARHEVLLPISFARQDPHPFSGQSDLQVLDRTTGRSLGQIDLRLINFVDQERARWHRRSRHVML